MPTANRVGLYARVSTRDKGQDTENQLAQLRQFCAANHWPITAEFIDHVSGKRSDRERFQRMFVSASRREFDYLVTWALDRLSREGVAMTFEHIKQLRGYGVEYISFTEPHFRTTGPAGELMIAVAAWIAEQEHRRISERVRAGLEKARKQGRIGGRRKLVLDYDRLAELDESGLTMREIAVELGVSPAFVCRALKARQRSPTGVRRLKAESTRSQEDRSRVRKLATACRGSSDDHSSSAFFSSQQRESSVRSVRNASLWL
jgi:DNA invertase Pin-like site-specific DNA recombinase